MKTLFAAIALALTVISPATAGQRSSGVQDDPDPALMAEILKIRAIDNHAHPMKIVRDGEKPDEEYDALPVDAMQLFDMPTHIRPDNPYFIAVWRELYGYPYHDMSPAHLKDLLARKQQMVRRHGDGYSAWVLDRLGIETMIANRVALGRGLTAPRFRWVAFDDALLFPLDNGVAKRRNSEYASMYAGEEKLLRRYLQEAGQTAAPETLDAYLTKVITPTLERQRAAGALAVKFEASYLRGLDFAMAPEAEARRVYEQFIRGGEPPAADYKALQDFLFHYIAREAGRLGLAVHFHTGAGVGAFFDLAGADPLKLEPVFDDPALQKTRFVLLHGGWPFEKSTAFLLSKPNVYADFSYQTFLFTPRQLSQTIKTWLVLVPEKVLFATDAATITPEVNWEEIGWLSNQTGRRALALALTDMMREGEITRGRASELARMVLRNNAIRLYKLK
jgi:hypothetical protein